MNEQPGCEAAGAVREWLHCVLCMKFYRSAILFVFAALVPLLLLVLARLFWPRLVQRAAEEPQVAGKVHSGRKALLSWFVSLGSAARHVLGGALFLGLLAALYGVTKSLVGSGGADLYAGLTIGTVFASAILGTKIVQSEVGSFVGKAMAVGRSMATGTASTPILDVKSVAKTAFEEMAPQFIVDDLPAKDPTQK